MGSIRFIIDTAVWHKKIASCRLLPQVQPQVTSRKKPIKAHHKTIEDLAEGVRNNRSVARGTRAPLQNCENVGGTAQHHISTNRPSSGRIHRNGCFRPSYFPNGNFSRNRKNAKLQVAATRSTTSEITQKAEWGLLEEFEYRRITFDWAEGTAAKYVSALRSAASTLSVLVLSSFKVHAKVLNFLAKEEADEKRATVAASPSEMEEAAQHL
jgi:hypothetical protein